MSSAVTGTGNRPAGGGRGGGGSSGGNVSAKGSVDISNWSLFGRAMPGATARPTPFLVGPIVGAVTETSARVLVEVDKTTVVTMEAFMDGAKVCSLSQEVRAKTPTVFKLRGFSPAKRVRVVVGVGEFGQEREARFTTTSDKVQWKIAAVSCNCHTHIEKLGLWDRLSRVAGDLDCVLHLGDQIYGDEDFAAKSGTSMRFESAWQACLTILEPVPQNEWANHKPELLECYRKTYRKTWNMPMVAKVLASAANYMICDDHEFTDDLGDEPEHSNPSTVDFFVARVAYQVFCEYQKQLLLDVDVTDHTLKPYYAFRLSPKVGMFMTDNRVERSLHRRTQGPDSLWKDRDFLGPDQWNRLTQALNTDFADCDTVLFGAPTPLVFISQAATGVAQKKIDDARGTWGHKSFITEQKACAHLLSDWQQAKPNRALITLAGDVHIGGFTDSWHNDSSVPLHQMTASAVGNTPERDIDSMQELLMRTIMHADERLFKFKVKHYEWIFGPNYGMVDIELSSSGRPNVTLTLVPQSGSPKIRNLDLGNSKVEVKNADHSLASKSAHATAEIMGVPPQGAAVEGVKPPGCSCACSLS